MNRKSIRPATPDDAARIAEIEVFNYRLNFYPVFRNDSWYFSELSVRSETERYAEMCRNIYVYDDGAVKGFIHVDGKEIVQLFVEPVLQGQSIGTYLLEFAVNELGAEFLYALEKNTRAIKFYQRSGFHVTDRRKPEEDTEEFLIMLEKG